MRAFIHHAGTPSSLSLESDPLACQPTVRGSSHQTQCLECGPKPSRMKSGRFPVCFFIIHLKWYVCLVFNLYPPIFCNLSVLEWSVFNHSRVGTNLVFKNWADFCISGIYLALSAWQLPYSALRPPLAHLQYDNHEYREAIYDVARLTHLRCRRVVWEACASLFPYLPLPTPDCLAFWV